MFTTLSSFSVFFFSVAAILLVGIIFEEKFLQLEDKIDKYFERKKREKKLRQVNDFRTKNTQFPKNRHNTLKGNCTTGKFAA